MHAKRLESRREIDALFATLRGVHRPPRSARIHAWLSAALCGGGPLLFLGALAALQHSPIPWVGRLLLLTLAASALFFVWVAWKSATTHYVFTEDLASLCYPASRTRWSIRRDAVTCAELVAFERFHILRFLASPAEPARLVQVLPSMRDALAAWWPELRDPSGWSEQVSAPARALRGIAAYLLISGTVLGFAAALGAVGASAALWLEGRPPSSLFELSRIRLSGPSAIVMVLAILTGAALGMRLAIALVRLGRLVPERFLRFLGG